MSTWPVIKTSILAACAKASGRSPKSFYWLDEPAPFVKGPSFSLNVFSSTPIHDRVTKTEIPEGQNNAGDKNVTLATMSDMVITVRAESPDARGVSLDALERIRLGMWLPSVVDSLRAVGKDLAWVGNKGSINPVVYRDANERLVSTYALDVWFRGTIEYVPSDEIVGTIEHVVVSGHVDAGTSTVDTTQTIDRPSGVVNWLNELAQAWLNQLNEVWTE